MRLINILRINQAPNWLYLQDYTGMDSQQNIKITVQVKTNTVQYIPKLYSHSIIK
jgi:hypothetical protein